MQLHKDEALLMRSVIFAFLLKHRDDALYESLQSLLHRLDDFLLSTHKEKESLNDSESENEEEVDEEVDEEEDEVDEEEDECIKIDELVSPVTLHNLPPLQFNHEGESLHLEFEDVDNEDSVDLLVDDDFEFAVVALKLENGQLHLFTSLENDQESHSYTFIKLPKKWSKTFEFGKIYGVEK